MALVSRMFIYIAELLEECGKAVFFFWESLTLTFSKPSRLGEIIKHMEFVGNKSILIIILTSSFTGMALSFQIYIGFNLVNATNLVGPTVAMGIFKELGPVLTGLIVAARAGGAMAARLGTMRVSEQIDALEVMGINPKQYLVGPRLIASFLTLPMLCAVFDFVAMFGSYIFSVHLLGLDEAIYFDKISQWISFGDVCEGLIKSAVFGIVFSMVSTYVGFYTRGGAKGVGDATNKGVVNSMVLIIVFNFIMTNIFRFIYVVTR